MLRRSTGASRGLRWGVFTLATVLAVVAVTTDPADARQRRKRAAHHHHKAESSYQPPYAAIVVDVNSGTVLHAASADSLRHPASLTKIMTLYLLFERLEAGKLALDTPMSVSSHAASQAPSKLGLKPGQTIEVEHAIKALVTKSANDVAVVVAEALAGDEDDFAALMTRKARALGMSRTVYKNASGLPDDEQVTTARDQALLGRTIQERFPRYYRYFSTPSFAYRGESMRNHNRLLGRVEGVDGIKTGYTQASGFNLVSSVRRGNRHIVAVVLGGRSAGSRDAKMRDLISEYVQIASVNRTAPSVADASEAASPVAKPQVTAVRSPEPRPNTRLASAKPPLRPDPSATATISASAASNGTDPIKPILVKTVSVKAGGNQVVSAVPSAMAPAQTISFPPPLVVAAVKTAPTQTEPPHRLASAATESPAVALPSAVQVAPASTRSEAPRASAPPRPDLLGVVSIASASAAEMPSVDSAAGARHATRGGWLIQIGAFEAEREAKERLNSAQSRARNLLGGADPFTERVVKGDKSLYRARFAGLDKEEAEAACRALKRSDIACFSLKN